MESASSDELRAGLETPLTPSTFYRTRAAVSLVNAAEHSDVKIWIETLMANKVLVKNFWTVTRGLIFSGILLAVIIIVVVLVAVLA